MPLDKFVLILVCVIAAAGATIWLGTLMAVSLYTPAALLILIPVLLVLYVLVRVIGQRVGNAEEDHYDKMDN